MADRTLSALVAAGVVYDKTDYADPRLDRPTALTVTDDGRVYGHLACWDVPHIGMARTTPPRSKSGYRYFHQGVVRTPDGDLPVGKLTLGTGHAPVMRGISAATAAAHYDNTGAVVATVRAGEDDHGIWLAGRLIPAVSDAQIDELRRSGVSGDWRGINGAYELVAALAVNVPGFPIPRTEELVAGATMALVAAGMVPRRPARRPAADARAHRRELAGIVAAATGQPRRRRASEIIADMERRQRVNAIIAAAGRPSSASPATRRRHRR